MPHADPRRARIGRAAARRSRGEARSGEAQVRRKRQREIQEARGILIPISHRSHRDRERRGQGESETRRKIENHIVSLAPFSLFSSVSVSLCLCVSVSLWLS